MTQDTAVWIDGTLELKSITEIWQPSEVGIHETDEQVRNSYFSGLSCHKWSDDRMSITLLSNHEDE